MENNINGLEMMSKDELIDLLQKMMNGGVSLSFNGKRTAQVIQRKVMPRVVKINKKLSFNDENGKCKNLIIDGENLQGMVTLYKYKGTVDLILTDPPYNTGIIGRLRKYLSEKYHCEMDEHCTENVINMMTNEFPTSAAKKTYAQCVFLKKEQDDYGISDVYGKMLQNPEFCAILEELVDFGISRYKVNYSYQYQDTNLVLYQKYTYEDACRLLNWERNEVPLNIGGYKYDKKTKTFPIFINYDKQDNISDTTKYEDHFVAENRLIAISKSGRSMDSEDVQNFLNATERGIDVQLFVRKNKDDKISKEFYYLGRVIATGNAKQFVMPNTDKTAVEIEWELETPVREDIYQYIVNE